MPIQSINPHDLQINRSFPETTPSEVLRIIEKVGLTQHSWAEIPVELRSQLVCVLATHLRQNIDFHAKTITSEMGKPISEARAEVEKCAILCDYYGQTAPSFLADKNIESDYEQTLVRYEPLGIILAIMPWNFPYWQVFRAAIPALLSGNAVILKHASNTIACALTIEATFQGAGLPMDIFRAIPITGQNSNILIAHPDVSAITFTGSNAAGEKIAALAGTQLKKTVMELGGSDPSIVLEDADLELSATKCVRGRMLNAGQSCIAAKRILIHESIAEPFTRLVVHKIKAIKQGDPMDANTQMGPLATEPVIKEIHRQVTESILMGANCLVGGTPLERKGHYYAPTLLSGVTGSMPVWKEETFGPVMCLTTFTNDHEAILLANDTQWGLGSSVYSRDIDRAMEVGKKIQSGTCTINDFVKSDPGIPFGGVKKSGYGRELSQEGILEFTNLKVYNIAK